MMSQHPDSLANPDPLGSRTHCPDCGGPTSRIPRRLIDRAVSLLRPMQRYRCRSFACQWVGNFPLKAGGSDTTDRPTP